MKIIGALIFLASVDIVNVFGQADTVNGSGIMEATVAISENNQAILNYRDDKGDGNLYLTILINNKWGSTEKLDKIVNNMGWEQSECISADGNWLYFTSRRKGGFGGKDIYRSKKLPNGEWSRGVNLGPQINTSCDEEAPVILPDGTTLYFSSNRFKAIKNFDLFVSTLADDGNWAEPVNVGYPFSKMNDTVFYSLIAKDSGSVPSTVNDSIVNENSSYIFSFNDKNGPMYAILKGRIINPYGEIPRLVKIVVADNESGGIVSLYNITAKEGNYSFILPPERNYNITYRADGYLFQSENMDLCKINVCYGKIEEIQIPSIIPGSKVILNNIFYDSAKTTVRSVSNVELDNMYDLLYINSAMQVEISSYMIFGKTSRKDKKKNKIFLEQRAQAVAEHLIKKGIEKERIVAKGYAIYEPKTPYKKSEAIAVPVKTDKKEWMELNVIEKDKSQ